MSFNFSPKIVRNGLVTYYDAANSKSFVSGSTTWSDMYNTPMNDLTLFTGAIYNPSNYGTMVYDGLSGRTSNNTFLNTGNDFTVSVWMKASILGTTRRGLIGNSYAYVGRNGWYLSTSGGGLNNTFFFSIGADTVYKQCPANTLTANTWFYLTVTVQNGGQNVLLYRDTTLITGATGPATSGVVTYNVSQFHVGCRIIGNYDYFTGNISVVQIYNRVLSSTEIAQNYNTTKSRYGKL